MSAFNWSAVAFILAAIGLVVFMLVVPRLLGGRSQGSQKEEIFEAGVVGAGNARIRLSAKFYLVAIFFVIFDLEALYLYAYAVSVREAGWLGFAAATVFITILIIGLIYELSLGAMNWAPADKRRKKHVYMQRLLASIWQISQALMALMNWLLIRQARYQHSLLDRLMSQITLRPIVFT